MGDVCKRVQNIFNYFQSWKLARLQARVVPGCKLPEFKPPKPTLEQGILTLLAPRVIKSRPRKVEDTAAGGGAPMASGDEIGGCGVRGDGMTLQVASLMQECRCCQSPSNAEAVDILAVLYISFTSSNEMARPVSMFTIMASEGGGPPFARRLRAAAWMVSAART